MILALVSSKGGVSKTTTATNVAYELVARGAKVLLVDADPQGSARAWAETASAAGRSAPTTVAMGAELHRKDQLPQLAVGYDHVIIDGPPRYDAIARSILMTTDLAVLPCGQSGLDSWALGPTLALVNEARGIRPALQAVVLLTRVQPRSTLGQTAREALGELGLPVLAAELHHRVVYQEAASLGDAVTRYAPKSEAAHEVRALVDELLALRPAKRPPKKGKRRHGE